MVLLFNQAFLSPSSTSPGFPGCLRRLACGLGRNPTYTSIWKAASRSTLGFRVYRKAINNKMRVLVWPATYLNPQSDLGGCKDSVLICLVSATGKLLASPFRARSSFNVQLF